MSWIFTGLLLACLGLTLILTTLSLRLLRGGESGSDSYSTLARFFLIALRVAIGWHCFVEGMEKLSTPNWSSEAYLRESMGPFSGIYRGIAGDRLLAKLTVGSDEKFPAELHREWQQYLDAFAAFYKLDDKQLERARGILEQREKDTLTTLLSRTETVIKIAPYPPELPIEMTMKQRLEEHERLLQRVRDAEARFPTLDKDAHAAWKSAKADLAKWRGELKKTLDAETDKLKKIDPALKTKWTKSLELLRAKLKDSKDEKETAKVQKQIEEEEAKLWAPLGDVLTSEQRLLGPMPEPTLPITSWRMLEWSDFSVKWGLVILGGALLLGCCSRLSSFALAFLILTFYLAMPPLPGWPESPRLEGHYLLVNKTLIEVIALLALAYIPTGRWAGLDGCLNWCCSKTCDAPPSPPAA